MRYGFVGLGNLGGKLAGRLLGAGFPVSVFDLDSAAMAPLTELGAIAAPDLQTLASTVDHVITCLPSPSVSVQVQEMVLPVMAEGASLIEMSTVAKADVLASAARAEAHGVGFLELPVTGGVHLAARGELTLLVGGGAEWVALHRPVLDVMGNQLFHMGPAGSAALIKVITNMLAFIHLSACGEALMLAEAGGLDLATAWQAISASSGTSFVHETEGQLILNGSYDIGFTIDLALKDLGFASGFGEEFGVPLALAQQVQAQFEAARDTYGGDAQSPYVVKLLEDALGRPLRAPGFPAQLV
jgi:3-hydroxyisobutyrate dehydrogenase